MATPVTSDPDVEFADLEGITFANVDRHDRALVARVQERDLKQAGERTRAAVRRLQDLGILDAQGKLTSGDLPEDMREGSQTDFGG